MSFVLESLGRGLVGRMIDVFEPQLPSGTDERRLTLARRCQQSPGSMDLALRLGFACLRDMHLAEARSIFEPLTDKPAGRKLAALGLACVHDELGQVPQTQRALNAARRLDAADASIAFALGLCAERAGEVDEAVRHYRRATQLAPTLSNAYERLAAMHVADREWLAAAALYERLAALAPEDSSASLLRGALLLEHGDP